MLWGTLYLVFLWIYGASTGIWRYGLNIQSARAAGAVALLPAICFVTWLIWFMFAKLREAGICAGRRLVAIAEGEGGWGRGRKAGAGGAAGEAESGLPR
jgi:hypothetical protein